MKAVDWNDQLHLLVMWCVHLDRERSVRDPWEEIQRQQVPFALSPQSRGAALPFTVKEFQQIQKGLGVMKALLMSYAKEDATAKRNIEDGIAMLLESAKSQDRKAWFFLAVGFIANLAVSLALAPDQTRRVYESLKECLTGVLQLVAV